MVLTPEVGEVFEEQARQYRGAVLEIGVGSQPSGEEQNDG